ncbi:hypothetical protein BCR32DRAFT_272108 [Anaeromyces robustus]|uniref:RlpA-like protein double-psi beta-barrel domain-containing protein n=1 Tax=Anaeromyces robustus TaxID=1754192 RepID=A0A1Y1WNI7_9FUNG|nr:hypothetical protein BCR32DRAFT_272108 [Anaeromyces robustus]|eukprot:ORX75117.1 hypothetical protein BCR32DRAFT_272108 [Anaeromyces robustus]
MKLLNVLFLFGGFISYVLAGASSYQITYYGCPNECSSQEHPSCGIKIYPDSDNKYFCALSKKLSGYEKYCGQRVIVMLTDGSKTMINVQVVDSCSSCEQYHVDLSSYSFSALLDQRHGVANVIWGIYNSSGNKLLGPIYNSLGSAPSKFGLSSGDFLSAFDANASKMAKNGQKKGEFSSSASGSSPKPTTTQKTTTQKTTTSTAVIQNPTNNPSQQVPTTLPPKQPTSQTSLPSKSTISSLPPKVTEGPITTNAKTVPTKTLEGTGSVKTVNPSDPIVKEIAKEKENKDNGSSAVGIVACIGGGVLGAAGVSLLLMKKKSPGTYEDMKQKFPEAFSQVKRGISRRATSIKRKVTKREPNTNATIV